MFKLLKLLTYTTTLVLLHTSSLLAQPSKMVKGVIINHFTKERIAFTSVFWKQAGTGVTTDSAGNFTLQPSAFNNDSIVVSYIGYENVYHKYNAAKDTGLITIALDKIKSSREVTVKSKFSKGLRWWKNTINHKQQNNPYKYNQYSYELYNKLELDLNNVTNKSFENIKMLKPFSFLLNNIDSVSETTSFLPVFMTESLSDYYHSKNPEKFREVIKAVEMHGIKNETVMQYIGGISQKINIYQDYMKLFGKEFISPLCDVADQYYHFKGADTQTINGEKFFHLIFKPLREGENTFIGDCWLHSKSWSIYKITLNLSSSADINYVHRLSITQEFSPTELGLWMFAKDKIVADVSPFKKDKLTFIARKTSTYKNIKTNADDILIELDKNKKNEEVIVVEGAQHQEKNFWNTARHEPLNNNEQKVFRMIDTLKTIPLFKSYIRNFEFLVDGYRKIGMFEIGPWFKWFSGNRLEGFRTRFDLGTTEKFNKNLRLTGYLAYGFKDEKFKGGLSANYKFGTKSGWWVNAGYTNDFDNGRIRYMEEDMTIDNIFSQLLRRRGIPQKFMGIEESKLSIGKEWENNLSSTLTLSRSQYTPFSPLPSRDIFTKPNGNNLPLINAEALLRLRYAPGEKTVKTRRKKIRLSRGSDPIYELRVSQGLPDIFNSEFEYTKVHAGITQKFRIPRWGSITYNTYGGKIFSPKPLPFMLLELHPGNEFYSAAKNGFNLMNRFEYFSDEYAGFNIEHNIEKKLINILPFMRKSKVRQFWNVKAVWGNLTNDNRKLNKLEFNTYRLRTLNDQMYWEFGTGLDNIFGFFRIDLVWRKAPHLTPNELRNNPVQNFGVFGSLKIQF